MWRPKAYEPVEGEMYQFFHRNLNFSREWEHLDYAPNLAEMQSMKKEYRLIYNGEGMRGCRFMVQVLPKRYWPTSAKKEAI
jgi:hypothetical protein